MNSRTAQNCPTFGEHLALSLAAKVQQLDKLLSGTQNMAKIRLIFNELRVRYKKTSYIYRKFTIFD